MRVTDRATHRIEDASRADSDQAADMFRIERLVEVVDHCSTAKTIAEAVGETFLAYMLSMTIQAARTAMRSEFVVLAEALPVAWPVIEPEVCCIE